MGWLYITASIHPFIHPFDKTGRCSVTRVHTTQLIIVVIIRSIIIIIVSLESCVVVLLWLPKVEADMNFCSMIRNLSTWSSSSLFTTSASFRASVSLLLLLLILPPIMLVLLRVRLRLFLLDIVVFVDPSMISAMLLLLLDVDGESMSDASSFMVLIHESTDLLKKRNISIDRWMDG